MSRHSSPTLWRANVCSPWMSAARLKRSAIVFEPIVTGGAAASINFSSLTRDKEEVCRLGGGGAALGGAHLGGLGEGGLVETCEEEGLVDATLEDGNSELHALDDHFATLQTGLAGQFGGRQVNGH